MRSCTGQRNHVKNIIGSRMRENRTYRLKGGMGNAVQRRLREWVRPLLDEPSEPDDLEANPSAGSSVLYRAAPES